MVSHYENDGPLRFRQLKRTISVDVIYTFDTRDIRHLKDASNPAIRAIRRRGLSIAFSPEKGLGKWPYKNLDKDLQHPTRRDMSLMLLQKESARRVTGDFFGAHHSLGSRAIAKQKGSFLSFLEPGWYLEKVLWCCTLFTSIFTFYDRDVVHFSRLCKSWSFFDCSFSRFQLHWSWLRSRLILLGFRELNKLKFPLMSLPFSQRFPVIYSLCSPFQENLYPIRQIKVFLVRWNLFDLF